MVTYPSVHPMNNGHDNTLKKEYFIEAADDFIEDLQAVDSSVAGFALRVEIHEIGDGGEHNGHRLILFVKQLIVGAPRVQINIGHVHRQNIQQQQLVDFTRRVSFAQLVFQATLPRVIHPPDKLNLTSQLVDSLTLTTSLTIDKSTCLSVACRTNTMEKRYSR